MEAIALVDIVDKYSPPTEVGKGKNKREEYKLFCKKGDRLTILTKNAGAWCIVVAVECKGKRFSIRWDQIKIDLSTVTFEL